MPGPAASGWSSCRYFVLDRFRVTEELLSPYERRLSLWLVLDGKAELHTASGYRRAFAPGGTVLVPASAVAAPGAAARCCWG